MYGRGTKRSILLWRFGTVESSQPTCEHGLGRGCRIIEGSITGRVKAKAASCPGARRLTRRCSGLATLAAERPFVRPLLRNDEGPQAHRYLFKVSPFLLSRALCVVHPNGFVWGSNALCVRASLPVQRLSRPVSWRHASAASQRVRLGQRSASNSFGSRACSLRRFRERCFSAHASPTVQIPTSTLRRAVLHSATTARRPGAQLLRSHTGLPLRVRLESGAVPSLILQQLY